MSDDIDHMVAKFEAPILHLPNYPYLLLGVAELVAKQKDKLRAFQIARRALAAARGDPATIARGRRLLASLLPKYHIPMMNDARRNAAWDKALRRAIRPGMHVLEIGTGAGMLALMAARAGAEKVVTCERHPVAAEMARELAARNGYADRITVITKRSSELVPGYDLERPADLLFCDIFADSLLDFDPLPALTDARRRLLAPKAPVVPGAGSLRIALGDWKDYARRGLIESACGFDLRPFAQFVPTSLTLQIGDPSLRLVSPDQEAFRFDFSAHSHPKSDLREFVCTVREDSEVNVIVSWIKLELDDETVLESRPEAGAISFSGCIVSPLEAPLHLRAGENVRVGVSYDDTAVGVWFAGA